MVKPLRTFKCNLMSINELKTLHISGLLRGSTPWSLMKAVTVIPLVKDSLALRDMPKPSPKRGQVLLGPIEVGVCGTDKDIIEGRYGAPPPGEEYLILGHEAVAEVIELGDGVDNVGVGDIVVPTVRRPTTCTLPITELDYCPRGTYAEHGIWYLHGFAAEFAVTDSQYLVKVPKEPSMLPYSRSH